MKDFIFGMACVADQHCQFLYNLQKGIIDLYTGPHGLIVPEDTDRVIGTPCDNLAETKILYKLRSPIPSNFTTTDKMPKKSVLFVNQSLGVKYFVEEYQEDVLYTKMFFQFPELDYFIFSPGVIQVSDNNIESLTEKTLGKFSFKYCDKDVSISFDVKIYNSCKCPLPGSFSFNIKTASEICLDFPPTNDFDFLYGLYWTVRCFFSFICNRQNIGLKSVVLQSDNPEGLLFRSKMCFNHKYIESEETDKVCHTPNIKLFRDHLPNLFELFIQSDAESLPVVTIENIHRSAKYRNLIDLDHSLRVMSDFEYYVREFYPSLRNRENGRDTSLKEKMEGVYNGTDISNGLNNILSSCFSDVPSLITDAKNWRNNLAHKKRNISDKAVIRAVRFVECMNYCMVFRKSGYTDEQIKCLIDKIFF